MSLVYLITGLPALELGKVPAITRDEFAQACRANLTGPDLLDLEQTLLLGEIEITIRDRNRDQLGQSFEPTGSSLMEVHRKRALAAARNDHLFPPWILKQRPAHLMTRYWFQKVYWRARSKFLIEYGRMALNLEEMITGLLCKQAGLDRSAFLAQMEGGFDSTWRVMVARYEDPDLGIGKRFPNFATISEALQLEDFRETESRLNRIRWALIDRNLGTEPFALDQVLAYYFRLRIAEREAAWDLERGQAVLDEILQFSPEKIP